MQALIEHVRQAERAGQVAGADPTSDLVFAPIEHDSPPIAEQVVPLDASLTPDELDAIEARTPQHHRCRGDWGRTAGLAIMTSLEQRSRCARCLVRWRMRRLWRMRGRMCRSGQPRCDDWRGSKRALRSKMGSTDSGKFPRCRCS